MSAEALKLAAWLEMKAEHSPGRIQFDEDEARLAASALRLLAQPAPAQAEALRASLEALAAKWEWEATPEGKEPHWLSPAGVCAETLTACAADIRAALAAAGEGENA